jgi:GR25 family glycosyltransferase involved in LPS biosynthesis
MRWKNRDILSLSSRQVLITPCRQSLNFKGDSPVESKRVYHKMDSDTMPGAFGYIVNKKAAAYLLRFSLPMNFPIDVFIPSNARNLNIYAVSPLLLDADYEIESTITN